MSQVLRFKNIIGAVIALTVFLPLLAAMGQQSAVPAVASTQAPAVGTVDWRKEDKMLENEMRSLSQTMAAKHIKSSVRFVSGGTPLNSPWRPYMQKWVSRVKAVGTRNFPRGAVKAGVPAEVVVTACILQNGKLASVEIDQSSGLPVVDAAAVQAVRSANPFPPLVSSEAGVKKLCITRTFVYQHGSPKLPPAKMPEAK